MRRRFGYAGLVLSVLAVLLAAVGGCARREDQTLVLGLIKPSLDHLPVQMAMAFDDPGLTDVEVRYFVSGWEVGEALAAGRLDAAILPFTYAWTAVSRGMPVRIACFLERESDGIVAGRDVGSLEDLDGRRIGVLRASTLEVLAVMALQDRGIEAELVPLRSPAEMAAALRSGDVDALSFYVPPILTLGDQYHVVHWYGEDHPHHPCCDLVVHGPSVERKMEALRRLQAALSAAVARTGEADGRSRLVAVAGDRYNLPPMLAEAALARTRFELGREESGRLFQLQAAAIMRDLGHIETIPDTNDVYLPLDRR
jgi:ABC-type nitrate/sulfonate/bicarbonate transport system substrate-binding protein